jgi:hypothetical protein
MDKSILVFGDSNTYGDGLPDCGHEKPWEQHSQLTWPYHMFDKEKIKNFSRPGCSNDTIGLELHKNASGVAEVLIMFTFPERLHIVKNGYNFIASHNFSQSVADSGNENWVAKQLNEKHAKTFKDFVVKNFDDDYLEILFLRNILFCQYFCDSNNLKYYFTLVTKREKNKMSGTLKRYRDSLYNSVKWENIFLVEDKYGFVDYAKKINTKRGLDGEHFGQDYHELFGKLFLDWIKEKKQV